MKKIVFILIIIITGYLFVSWAYRQGGHTSVLSDRSYNRELPSSFYPKASLTPGDIFPNVTVSDVCVLGYTKNVRNVSVEMKRYVYQEYGLVYPQPRGAYEVDHIIPLELGGSNDIKNLWPEPASPFPGFHQKDIVENYLHKQVCSGKESLSQAQEDIRSDWYRVYKQIPNPYSFGGNGL